MIRRMIGAAKLRKETFEEVEEDSSATIQAMLVVVIVAVATGIGTLGTGGPLGLILGIIVGLAHLFHRHQAAGHPRHGRRLGTAR